MYCAVRPAVLVKSTDGGATQALAIINTLSEKRDPYVRGT